MDKDTESEDEKIRDLSPEKDAKGGRRADDIARPRKPSLSTNTGGTLPVPPIPAPSTDPYSSSK